MAQRNYLISTTDLSPTASGTTIGSGNTQSSTFVVARTLIRSGLGAGELLSGSQTWSLHYVVSAMSTPYEMRLKVQRLNSGGTMQAESGYTTVRTATGTYDDNLTADLGTWAANDQLAVVWEHRRPSGTGNKSGTIDANGASYLDAPSNANVTINLTGAQTTLSPGSFGVSHDQPLTGSSATVSPGTAGVSHDQPLTGAQITGAAGSLTFALTPIFAQSSFTVGADMALSGYEGEINGTFTKHPHSSYASGEYNVDAATGRVWQSNTVAYYSNGIPASADYYAECEFFHASTIAQNLGPCVRMDTTANTFYQLRLRDGIDWQIRRTVNDAQVATLATSTDNVPTAGNSKRGRIVVQGDQVWAEIEGGTVIGPVTDTLITAAGRAGIRGAGIATSSTGMQVSDFKAANGTGDRTAALTGIAATSAAGNVGVDRSTALTGNQATAAQGSPVVERTHALTGSQTTAEAGTVTGSVGGGDVTLALTGVAATGAAGSLGVDRASGLTGEQATATAGSLAIGVTVGVSGVSATLTPGNLAPALSVALAGSQAALSAGLLTPDLSRTLTGVANIAEIGSLSVSTSVPLTGNLLTVSPGQVGAGNDVIVALSGVSVSFAAGTLTTARELALTGTQGDTQSGDVVAAHVLALDGQTLDAEIGSLAAELAAALQGEQSLSGIGSVSPSLVRSIDGMDLTSEIGALSVSHDHGLTGVEAIGTAGSLAIPTETPRVSNTRRSVSLVNNVASPFTLNSGRTSAEVKHGR